MKIKEKLLTYTRENLQAEGPINVVIFGDSVSHAAFNGYHDYESVYWNRLKKKLNATRAYMPVNMICAAIGGTSAHASLERLDSQVLKHEPDLVIVCFGLNDVNGEYDRYVNSLREIFERCHAAGVEVIFLSPNMLNTYVAEDTSPDVYEYAKKTAVMQNEGRMDKYIFGAMDLAREMGVAVCDCYSIWKERAKRGEDVTMLLSNRINHPTEQMHEIFAEELYKLIMSEGSDEQGEHDSGMFKG